MIMRDKIADSLVNVLEHYRSAYDIEYHAADAILAALPDMIPDLVWDYRGDVSCTAHTPFGKYLVETCHEDGFGMWTPCDETEDDPPFGFHGGMAAAQAAANADRRAVIMAAFKGEKT
jgi:hypothetical protein